MPTRFSDAVLNCTFEDTFWPHAWARGTPPMKTERLGALREYKLAARRGSNSEALSQAIQSAAKRFAPVDPQYRPSVRKWLHNGGQFDEPDAKPVNGTAVYTREALEIIAAHVRAPYYQRGRVSREVMEQCVAADLLTRDEMEAAL